MGLLSFKHLNPSNLTSTLRPQKGAGSLVKILPLNSVSRFELEIELDLDVLGFGPHRKGPEKAKFSTVTPLSS